MKAVTTFVRNPNEHPLPPRMIISAPKTRGRPQVECRIRIASEDDAKIAARHEVPVSVLSADRVSDLGYPVRFPSELVIARSILSAVETPFRTIPFVSETAARDLRPEDHAVAMLRLDMIGARALVDRNPTWDRPYLARRVFEEHLEWPAAYVRFSDTLPQIPTVPDALDRERLERRLAKHRVRS